MALMDPKRVKITLTPTQFEALSAAAAALGLTLADYIRMRVIESLKPKVAEGPSEVPLDPFDAISPDDRIQLNRRAWLRMTKAEKDDWKTHQPRVARAIFEEEAPKSPE